ncbi:MAG: hypothetical protein ACJA1A_001911 [Saprospiraceae bacterium]|jgi:hypothetical protein|tara:strand:- start:960 stop:1493 length:534 start_codon:yes stop_codon:yes gene_type:complete
MTKFIFYLLFLTLIASCNRGSNFNLVDQSAFLINSEEEYISEITKILTRMQVDSTYRGEVWSINTFVNDDLSMQIIYNSDLLTQLNKDHFGYTISILAERKSNSQIMIDEFQQKYPKIPIRELSTYQSDGLSKTGSYFYVTEVGNNWRKAISICVGLINIAQNDAFDNLGLEVVMNY